MQNIFFYIFHSDVLPQLLSLNSFKGISVYCLAFENVALKILDNTKGMFQFLVNLLQ